MTLKALLTSDLTGFFNESEFASAAQFSHAAGAAVAISVIFDTDFLASLGIETNKPTALCKSSDVASAVHGDTMVIGSTTYKIIGIQPDGTGITIVILSKEAA